MEGNLQHSRIGLPIPETKPRMTMDIESLAITLTEGATQNFEEFGYVSTVTLFIMNGGITPLPQQLMDILNTDRERFYANVRELVKKHNPDVYDVIRPKKNG